MELSVAEGERGSERNNTVVYFLLFKIDSICMITYNKCFVTLQYGELYVY